MAESTTLGAEFARALAAKDFDRVAELMHPEIEFRGMTPSRSWEASDPGEVISGVLRQWFEDSDEIEALEQQAYLADRDGQIGWMRVVCPGFRPAT